MGTKGDDFGVEAAKNMAAYKVGYAAGREQGIKETLEEVKQAAWFMTVLLERGVDGVRDAADRRTRNPGVTRDV